MVSKSSNDFSRESSYYVTVIFLSNFWDFTNQTLGQPKLLEVKSMYSNSISLATTFEITFVLFSPIT